MIDRTPSSCQFDFVLMILSNYLCGFHSELRGQTYDPYRRRNTPPKAYFSNEQLMDWTRSLLEHHKSSRQI